MSSILLLLAFTTAIGWAASAFFAGSLTRSERAAWAFVCGLMVHAVLYAIGIALRLHPGPRKLLAVESVILIVAVLVRRNRRREPRFARAGPDSGLLFAAGLIAAIAGIALFTASALAEPMWATDFLAIWGLKGKTIFFASGVPDRLFRDPELTWAHPEYPLLLPLVFASLSAAIRDWNDHVLAALYPLFQIATVLAAYGFLARRTGRAATAIAAALIALFVPLYRAGHVGMADIPLALGLVLVSTAFLDALEGSSASVRVRLAVSALFCAALKQEGLLYVVLLAVTMLWTGKRQHRREVPSTVLALLLPPAVHWAGMWLLRGRLINRDFDWSLTSPERWSDLLGRTIEVASRILRVEIAGAAAALLAIGVLLIVTRRSFADPLFLPLAVQALAYAAVCAFSAFGAVWLVEVSFARAVGALFPAFALVIGARSAELSAHARE